MREPVRILSDLHLGHRVSRIDHAEQLRPLVGGAGTLILNGDTWQELAAPFRERSRAMLEELQWICAEEGADVVFVPGNHDPGWDHPGWVELAEGRIVVTHGDALFDSGSPWKRELLFQSQAVAALWQEYPEAARCPGARLGLARRIAREFQSFEHPLGRSLLRRAIDAAIPPQRAMRMLQCWAQRGTAGARFCERYFPQAEILVIGHFHRSGTMRAKGRIVIDTGSFLNPGPADWLEWNDGWLRRGRIEESGGSIRPGRVLDAWRIG
jgi:predicted phosphodiesterase